MMHVMVVEDSLVLAQELERILDDAGHTVVGLAPNVRRALRLISAERIDAAVLDVRLHDDLVYPVADALLATGRPVIFVTSCTADELPDRFRGCPLLSKPVTERELLCALNDIERALHDPASFSRAS